MKKIIAILLILALTVFSAGCGAQPEEAVMPTPTQAPFAQEEDLNTAESDPDMTMITYLSGTAAIAGEGASAEGTVVTINAGGMYYLSGACGQGELRIDTEAGKTVRLVLAGLSLASIAAEGGGKIIVTLAAGTQNVLSCAQGTALCTDGALSVNGSGTLHISSENADGVSADGALLLLGGNLTVTAARCGVVSSERIAANGGFLTVSAGECALSVQSTAETAGVFLSDGTLSLTAEQTGILSPALTADGGSTRLCSDGVGIDTDSLTLSGGAITIDAAGAGVRAGCTLRSDGGLLACGSGTQNASIAAGSGFAVLADESIAAETSVTLLDEDGTRLLSYTPRNTVGALLLCFPASGSENYTLQIGDAAVSFSPEQPVKRISLP